MNETEILSPTEVDATGWRPRVLGVRRIGGRAGFIIVTVLGILCALIIYGVATAGRHPAPLHAAQTIHAGAPSPSWLDTVPVIRPTSQPVRLVRAIVTPPVPSFAPRIVVPNLAPQSVPGLLHASVAARDDRGAAQAPILVRTQAEQPSLPAGPAFVPNGHAADVDPRERFGAAAAAAVPDPITVGDTPAAAPLTLAAGSVIPALLVSGINADLPGSVVARVRENVYDTQTGQSLLVPAGTTLLGRYDSHISQGERRVFIAWTKMTFDGTSVALGGIGATDDAGYAGLAAHVDEHLNKVFNGALLLSIISAGAQLSQPQRSAVGFAPPDVGQTMAGALGNQLSSVSLELAQRQLGVLPTLEVAPGYRFDVLVDRDITFAHDANVAETP